jgi:hypothetical protein
MVMSELPQPRESYVLDRGSYQLPTERVTAETPAVLPSLPPGAPRTRLTLARWLVSGRHPLTARVTVNRFWQLHFDQGLVRTPDDFGTRGERPTHPALLDWLADEFVASGWNVQHIERLIVTSETYRQTSRATSDRRALDEHNRLLSWFPRSRLPAEMIRDQALAASGLLEREMYGPGVFPYQPPGLWEEIGHTGVEFSAQKYTPGTGKELFRRSVYTFWKRTAPPPNMVVFDAPDRETCTAARGETNTPLQALVLWNDPTYVEAARHLAQRALRDASAGDDTRIAWMMKIVLSRAPQEKEVAVLATLLNRQRMVYRANRPAAESLVSVGESPRDERLDTVELAAWTMVAHALLNLDEALHR